MPAWMFIGTAAVLLPIFATLTISNINRQKEATVRLLVQKGAALIRAFEAGTRTGMMGPMRSGFRLQRLLVETAQLPDIAYLLITDEQGIILAGSDPQSIGETHGGGMDFEVLAKSADASWRWVKSSEGVAVFEVYRRFDPTGRPRRRGEMGDMMGRFPRERPPPDLKEPLPRQFIFVGLETGYISSLHSADVRHTVIMGVVLLFIGLSGILLLFLVQGYRSTRASLARIKALSDNVVENMPIGLVTLDVHRRISSFNSVAQSVLKLESSGIIGRSADEVLPLEIRNELNRLKPAGSIIEKEIDCSAADGLKIPLALSANLLYDEEHNFLGTVLLLKDMREVHALRKEILRNQRLASVGRLAAGVAHEVRNPLSSIKGFAVYFKERYRDKKEDQQIADIMIQEVDRLNRVIGQLLDFARPIKISPKAVEVARLIQDSLKLIEREAEDKSITIETRIAENCGLVNLDADRISQVLLNLYLNAVDAMESGGRLGVTVVRVNENGAVAFTVSDSGHGIRPEDIPHVFDPYYTTKSNGTGLGLAIVHNIIEAHGGRIDLESAPGWGTRFVLTLPQPEGK